MIVEILATETYTYQAVILTRNGGSMYNYNPLRREYVLYILPPILINAFKAFSEIV